MTNEKLDQARADEAMILYVKEGGGSISCIAARLAREGWTPPVPVDPDLAEAAVFENRYYAHETIETICLQAIKRGRALAAEAEPGLVWVKHDGSDECPIDINQPVLITNINRFYGEGLARAFYWNRVTHYAVITPPAEDVA